MAKMHWRESLWQQIGGPWDVLIIGGGVVGAGLLREAVRAGLRALLVEAHDFSSGTSSRSSKMVHGGLRYLKNGQIKLTMDSVHERQRLLQQGEGLIDPLEFLLVSYRGDRPPGWVYGMGLMIYDTLAMRWNHARHSVEDVRMLCPEVNQHQLVGGFRFYDAQTDDARLVLRILQEAQRAGGSAINYVRAENLLRSRSGQVRGAVVRDQVSGVQAEIEAGVVINATGAWADEVRGHLGEAPRLRRLRGSHLIFPHEKLPVNEVISFSHPRDHRPVFAFPWEGVTLVGTTDVDHSEAMQTDPAISQAEADYLMEGVERIFHCLDLGLDDVISTMAGIRSVLDTGKADPSRESRDEVLWNEDGLVTITGGKLTMYRHMAQKTLRFIRERLPAHTRIDRNARTLDAVNGNGLAAAHGEQDLDPVLRLRYMGRYGADAADLVRMAGAAELQPVGHLPTTWAELRWAARCEQVVHLEDLLLRRTRLGSLLPDGGMAKMERIRRICQPELGWSDSEWESELANYRSLWQQAYSLPQTVKA